MLWHISKICHGYGYQGRTGIFEIVAMTPDLAKLVGMGGQRRELVTLLEAQERPSLIENGLRQVAEGVTTMEELYRACGPIRKDIRLEQANETPAEHWR